MSTPIRIIPWSADFIESLAAVQGQVTRLRLEELQ